MYNNEYNIFFSILPLNENRKKKKHIINDDFNLVNTIYIYTVYKKKKIHKHQIIIRLFHSFTIVY
jgi:hypothetical protein